MYFSCFSPGINQFFKDPGFLLVENGILTSSASELLGYVVSVFLGPLSDTATEVCEYVCIFIHILSSVFLYVYIESHEFIPISLLLLGGVSRVRLCATL